jgi:adenylate kinase
MSTLSAAARRGSGTVRASLGAVTGLCALLSLSGGAGAVSERVKNACRDDYYKFCPGYDLDTPQLRSCITIAGRKRQLNPRCLDALIDAGEVPRKYLRH